MYTGHTRDGESGSFLGLVSLPELSVPHNQQEEGYIQCKKRKRERERERMSMHIHQTLLQYVVMIFLFISC